MFIRCFIFVYFLKLWLHYKEFKLFWDAFVSCFVKMLSEIFTESKDHDVNDRLRSRLEYKM